VGEAVTLWDDYGRLLAKLDKHQVFESFVLPVAKAISRGLDMALRGKSIAANAPVSTEVQADFEDVRRRLLAMEARGSRAPAYRH
jgi:hypothetical protein